LKKRQTIRAAGSSAFSRSGGARDGTLGPYRW
jgi:hypothetical protein